MKAVTETRGHLMSLLQLVEVGRIARGDRSFPDNCKEPGVAKIRWGETRPKRWSHHLMNDWQRALDGAKGKKKWIYDNKGQATYEEHWDVVRLYREKIKRVKSQIKLYLVTVVKNVSINWSARKGRLRILTLEWGEILWQRMKKWFQVLNVFFASGFSSKFSCSQVSSPLRWKTEEQNEAPIIWGWMVSDLPHHLGTCRLMRPLGIQPRILREMLARHSPPFTSSPG